MKRRSNVWRTFGPRLGIPTLVLDLAKGAIPALLGPLFGPLVNVLNFGYDGDATEDAWKRILAFFGEHLEGGAAA